jgi:hypothetical protein
MHFKFNIKLTDKAIDYNAFDDFMSYTENKEVYPLSIHSLKLIRGEKYHPAIPSRIIEEDGVSYLNIAIPSELMKVKGTVEKEPTTIMALLFNLVGEHEDRLKYYLNWIAFNFVYGIKPQVAVILFGDEGAGKGIFYYIMKKLYDMNNCNQINGGSFKSGVNLAPLIANRRFINFDEITNSANNRYESQLKAIITNDTTTFSKEIEVHAQCLFTANFSTAFKISETDRRYTVFNTGVPLKLINYLGTGSYEALELKIDSEMVDFAKYLKSFEVDVKLANTALDTPEKSSMKNRFQSFHDALVDLDIEYFYKIEELDFPLYSSFKNDMQNKRINRKHIKDIYRLLFNDEMSTTTLVKLLETILQKGIFTSTFHSGSDHYFYPKGKIEKSNYSQNKSPVINQNMLFNPSRF